MPLLPEPRRGPRRATPEVADDERARLRVELADAGREGAERHVHGARDVPRVPLVGLADVEHDEVVGQRVGQVGDGRRGHVHGGSWKV